MPKSQGHTLPELMICLLIGSLLLGLATPSFSSLLQSNQKTQQTNHLLGLLHYARGTAVLDKRTVTLCTGTTQCVKTEKWSDSLLIFVDANGNGVRDDGDILLHQATLEKGYSWHWASFRKRPHLTYQRDGSTRALNGTFTLCKNNTPLHQIVISLSGRVRTQPVESGRCF
ncbi:GspH/FimT family pseudopilin [Pseudomonas sp. Marseille-Q8238]